MVFSIINDNNKDIGYILPECKNTNFTLVLMSTPVCKPLT